MAHSTTIQEAHGLVTLDHAFSSTPSMARTRALVAALAPRTVSVIFVGERGVGKSAFADRLHALSPHAHLPLVWVDGRATDPLEATRDLLWEGPNQASDGTVAVRATMVLAHTSRMTEHAQSYIARALDAAGSSIRLVAVMTQPLAAAIRGASLHPALSRHLAGATIRIPPLRERLDDVEAMATCFILHASQACGRAEPPRMSAEFVQSLRSHTWPGNLYELEATISYAVQMCSDGDLRPHHLPPSMAANAQTSLREAVEEVERERVIRALNAHGGNQSRAAKSLGIARNTLIARMRTFGLRRSA